MLECALVGPQGIEALAQGDPRGRTAPPPDSPLVLWLDLDSPTDAERAAAAAVCGINAEEAWAARLRAFRWPRCTLLDGRVLLQSMAYRRRGAVSGDDFPGLSFILGPRALVTVHYGPLPVITALRDSIVQDPPTGTVQPAQLVLRALTEIADGLIDASQSLEEQAGRLEDTILTGGGRRPSRALPQTLLAMHRTGIKLRRLLVLEQSALERFQRLAGPTLSAEEHVALGDVLHQLSHAESLSDSVILVNESALNAHLGVLNNHMNDVMKVLTVFGTIFLPLTFLTGLYGTNFNPLPGAGSATGFWVLLGVSATVILGLSAFFYRLGWFRRDE